MRVALFVTCLVDQLRPEVGEATVEVLRRAGCEVTFDPRQTCCGQPAFNTGYLDEARAVGTSFLDVFDGNDADAIVAPSGSCAAMVHHLPELFEESDPRHAKAVSVANRTFELGTLLVRELGQTDLGARYEGTVTWHDACHGLRDLGIQDEPRALLDAVEGLEFVETTGCDTCCGFGGTFSVKHPELSIAMADWKLQHLETSGVDAVVSGDLSCLMQLGGRLKDRDSKTKALHLAEVLAAR